MDDSNAYIQKLNDEYTNPSGEENGELFSEEQAMEASWLRDTLSGDTGPETSKN